MAKVKKRKMAMSVVKIGKPTVLNRVKRVIGKIKGISPKDIYRHDWLYRRGEGGLALGDGNVLTLRLNEAFQDVKVVLKLAEVRGTAKVRNLRDLIWGKIPPRHKKK